MVTEAPAQQAPRAKVNVDARGGVHLPAMTVPFSNLASLQALTAFVERQKFNKIYEGMSALPVTQQRQLFDDYFKPIVKRVNLLYPVDTVRQTMAGVETEIYTPKEGVAARNGKRVLINLHGGGFIFGAGSMSALESIPLASVEKIKIVSIDYRLGPENQYPAASEDVAAVYKELLKSYLPRNIGIYGCSAGGLLTAEVVAWIQKEKLPAPGAVGIFCAAAAGWTAGDSDSLALPLSGFTTSPDYGAPPHPEVGNAPYFKDADLSDPLVLPIRSATVLAKFPPTLIITSTRDPALSPAVYTHTRLTQLGVDAQLNVWEGLFHGFFATDPDLPESKEVWHTVSTFFDKHLGSN
jgi:epsilon-lactone hydrolase